MCIGHVYTSHFVQVFSNACISVFTFQATYQLCYMMEIDVSENCRIVVSLQT